MNIEVLSSREVFTGRVFNVRRDHLSYPDGRETDYDLIVHPGAVAIIPLDEAGNLWFVEQYRHAVARSLLELPAGTLDDGEAPQVCAAREIREEIGFSADHFEHLGGFFLAPGYSNEYLHVFLASQLRSDPLPADENEILRPVSHPLTEVWGMLSRGDFQDAKTIAALFLAQSRLMPES